LELKFYLAFATIDFIMQSVLQALLHSMHEAVIVRSVGGHITGWNHAAERIYGYSVQEANQLHIETLIPEKRRPDFTMLEEKARMGESIHRLETVRRTKNGDHIRVLVTLVPLRDIEGVITHFVEITDPVRERNQTILSVAHNLRNALSAMSTASYMLEHQYHPRHLERLKRQLALCDSIVNTLLEHGGARASQREMVNLNRLSADVISLFDFPEGIEVKLVSSNEISASVDSGQIEQVLVNLLQNAVDALESNPGEIQIKIDEVAASARIEVSDNGPGIGLTDLHRIFEPLVTTKAKGIGLGLTACKQMVEANKGRIEVESQKGSGTRFSVLLPKA
jgi:PAS domain S-box-containing protein